MISFTLKQKEYVSLILKNVRTISFAESLGGVETLITYPFVQTHADIPEKIRENLGINDRLLRLSVGIESLADLIADLEQAFPNQAAKKGL
jgi:cystathionine gamma-synthase